jgi:hypothetical protein
MKNLQIKIIAFSIIILSACSNGNNSNDANRNTNDLPATDNRNTNDNPSTDNRNANNNPAARSTNDSTNRKLSSADTTNSKY